MKLEKLIQDFLIRKSQNLKVDRKKLFTSYVSLFLVSAVLITATFSWFTQKDSASFDTTAITLNATAGMRVNSGEELSGQIKLADNLKLAEASSVDGRNMYFPASESFTTTTSDMFFREGNAGDKNVKYYYKDFTLSSDSGDTDVYVKDFVVTVGENVYSTDLQKNNEQTAVDCPIRIAFILDSSEAPIVIDPTAAINEYATTYKAVSNTADDGTPIVSESKAHSFAHYYFSTNNPIFTIKDGEQLDVTMVAWLEGGNLIKNGSDTGSICQSFVGQSVNIMVDFETNWDNMDTIEFVDDTVGDAPGSGVYHWINTDNCIVTMSYIDAKTGRQKTLAMLKSPDYDTDYTWRASLPSGIVTNIIFNRYSPTEKTVWNAWYTQPGVNSMYDDQIVKDLEETRIKQGDGGKNIRCVRYVAKGGNGYQTTEKYRPYPCKGYWAATGGKETEGSGSSGSTKTSDWYLCSDFSGSSTEQKLVSQLGTDNVYTYTVSLNENSSYTFNFKNVITADSATSESYYGASSTITDTVTDQSIAKAEGSAKFTLNTTTSGDYTITLDVSTEDSYKFTITKKETVVGGSDCYITVTLQDNSSSSWVYRNYANGDKIYAVFSNGREVELKEKGYCYVEYLNAIIPSGSTFERIEMRNTSGTSYYQWNLNIKIKGNTTYKCTVNSNDKITVQE
ncbi:MAG: hypothetical protein ACI4HK_03670 [Ruminococcus sp.]